MLHQYIRAIEKDKDIDVSVLSHNEYEVTLVYLDRHYMIMSGSVLDFSATGLILDINYSCSIKACHRR